MPNEFEHLKQQVETLTRTVENLQRQLSDDIRTHQHDGLSATSTRIDDLDGLFETVSAAPTTVPKSIYDQIKIYVNGSTYRLYWYDNNANTWHYVTATA